MPLIILTVIVIFSYIKSSNTHNILSKDEKLKLKYYIFLLLFSNFFSFFMLAYANSILIVPLIIMIIIIERYVDYNFIDDNIEYVFIVISLLMILFFNQGFATVYYVITNGKHIEHFFNLVV